VVRVSVSLSASAPVYIALVVSVCARERACARVRACVRVRACMHVSEWTCGHACVFVPARMCVYLCVCFGCERVCVCVCACVRVCVCTGVHPHLHLHVHVRGCVFESLYLGNCALPSEMGNCALASEIERTRECEDKRRRERACVRVGASVRACMHV